jgi:Zn/Cd-binding protein ZinT
MSHFFAARLRKLVFCVTAFLAVAPLTAYAQSPKIVAENYIKAVANNRVEEAVGYFSLEDVKKNELTMAKGKIQMVVGMQYANFEENGGLDSVTATQVEQTDNMAEITVEMKFKNGETEEEDLTLIKDASGTWKIGIAFGR